MNLWVFYFLGFPLNWVHYWNFVFGLFFRVYVLAVVFGLVIFQGLIRVYALTVVFVVDFFQVGSG